MNSRNPETWFLWEKDRIRPFWLKKPFDNIAIGPDPTDGFSKDTAQIFDAVVNVSDSPCATFYPSRPDQKMYWYPINEVGRWGYGVFFWSKKVLDFHFDRKDLIYVHCHAGAHRSPAIVYWWLYSRGCSRSEAALRVYPNKQWKFDESGQLFKPENEDPAVEEESQRRFDTFETDIERGHIPPKLKQFYQAMEDKNSDALAYYLTRNDFINDSFECLAEGCHLTDGKRQKVASTDDWMK